MKQRSKLMLAIILLFGVLGISWITLSSTPKSFLEDRVTAKGILGKGILDGMTFAAAMRLPGDTDDVDDIFVFANGTFVSTECDERCGYPARPYFVRYVDDAVEFISESHCLYKDAKIVWRGTIKDGKISGVSTWTVKRWYWTIEKELLFKGTLVDTAASVAGG